MLQNLPAYISLNFLEENSKSVTSANDLGITLDSNLSYNEYISNLTSSCAKKLCQINRVKNRFDTKTLQLIIEARSGKQTELRLNDLVKYVGKNINKLQIVQNFAVQIIKNVRKFDYITPTEV